MYNNDLILYTQSGRPDRGLIGQARDIVGRTQLGALETDAAFALGAHVMEGAAQLDAHRRFLAGNDQQLNAMLCGIEIETVRQAKNIQRQTFNRFGI